MHVFPLKKTAKSPWIHSPGHGWFSATSGKPVESLCSDNASNGGKSGANTNPLLKCKKTKRGNMKGKLRKKDLKFSIIGSNSNGLSGKTDSLISSIKLFDRPSCVTIQETKLRSKNLKIPGYQVFIKNRPG